jgi:hypothetical protein
VSSLQALAQHSNDVTRVLSDIMLLGDIHTSSKNKKRKSADVETAGEEEENSSAASQRAVFSELVLRSEHVLSSVKSACVHDTEGFIDEVLQDLVACSMICCISVRGTRIEPSIVLCCSVLNHLNSTLISDVSFLEAYELLPSCSPS